MHRRLATRVHELFITVVLQAFIASPRTCASMNLRMAPAKMANPYPTIQEASVDDVRFVVDDLYRSSGELKSAIRRFDLVDEGSHRTVPLWQGFMRMLLQRGGDPWFAARSFGQGAYFHMHIPKAAGYSVIADSIDMLPPGTGFFSEEICMHDVHALKTLYRGSGMITFVRNPREHVYSQYLECASDPYFADLLDPNSRRSFDNLTVWLQHFTDGSDDGTGPPKDNMGCYHPLNMQTRYFSCSYIKCNGLFPLGCERTGAMQAHDLRNDPHELSQALDNFDKFSTIGLVEYYQESFCLFSDKVHGELPQWCNCSDPEARESFEPKRVSHHVPKHSINDVSKEDLARIDQLTQHDSRLYSKAQAKFLAEVRAAEQRHGMKILCDADTGS